MKPHESPRIRKKSIRGDSGDSWPVWNRGIRPSRTEYDSATNPNICHFVSVRGIRGLCGIGV